MMHAADIESWWLRNSATPLNDAPFLQLCKLTVISQTTINRTDVSLQNFLVKRTRATNFIIQVEHMPIVQKQPWHALYRCAYECVYVIKLICPETIDVRVYPPLPYILTNTYKSNLCMEFSRSVIRQPMVTVTNQYSYLLFGFTTLFARTNSPHKPQQLGYTTRTKMK